MVTRMKSNSHTEDKNIPLKKIEKALVGTRFKEFKHIEETGSTNVDLVLRASEAPDDLILVSDHQTAGKGRLGREWNSPKGLNLLCSFLLTSKWTKNKNPLVTSSLALGVVKYLSTIDVFALVKWPNDIVIPERKGKKISGILAEQVEGDIERIVVGMGLNISWPSSSGEGPPDAISLKMLDVTLDRWTVLAGIIENFEKQLKRLEQSNGSVTLRQDHVANSATIGNQVRVETANNIIVGSAEDITEEGLLVVNDGNQDLYISVGDVVNLRKKN